MWTTDKLKEAFLSYFEKNGHKRLPSSSVVPKNDPTLLFTNSGMVQFKNIFLGERPTHRRVVTSQRCIRAGGKHNDLDDVGKDNYHHTFFEMLGNWSFGDYFKEEAIWFAYDFLVNVLKMKKENIYVTIYEDMDGESRNIWGKYLPQEKILSASQKDNFWEMGEFGPCGPCTEIHYDRIGNRDASGLVNKDDPSVVEFWNIVFMEFERSPAGLEPLQIKNIDTGIGLERLLSILNDVKSNYLIDSFQTIIRFLETKCEFEYKDGACVEDVAFRVLADHSRTIAVCLDDKVTFSSDGVGYVMRRILRRAVRYAQDVLKIGTGVFSQSVGVAARFMGLEIDTSVVDAEEALFMNTLSKGLARLLKISETKERISGKDVFLLYDTYGFPTDLTKLICEEKGIEFSQDGFEECVNTAKNLSKSHKKIITINFDFPKTDDTFKYTVNGITAELQGIVVNNQLVSKLEEDTQASLVFDRTCFYGESGGQVGDRGVIEFCDENGSIVGNFVVENTQIQRGYVLHEGRHTGRQTAHARLVYDEKLRAATSQNHSTVHLVNHFLRGFIATAEQQGSYVDSEKCRLDFNGSKLSCDDLGLLEQRINDFVCGNVPVTVTVHTKGDIIGDASIIKMSDEDYPDTVRVINMNGDLLAVREVCGGTHVANTSEIGLVRLVSESGVKASVRRIVAVCGERAREVDRNAEQLQTRLAGGETMNVDCALSISEKSKIDALNEKNRVMILKELEGNVKALKNEIQEGFLNFQVKTMGKPRVFSYDCARLAKFTKKEIFKSLNALIKAVDHTMLLFVRKDEDVFVVARDSGMAETCAALQVALSSSNIRMIKNHLEGSVPASCFDLNDILNQLRS